MTNQTLRDMLRYSTLPIYRDKWVVVAPSTDDMAAGGFVSPHFHGEYGAYDWYLDPENHATHIVRNGVVMVWRKEAQRKADGA